jgi:two-component system NtrC family sensor kinase
LKEYNRLRIIDPDAAPKNYEAQFLNRGRNIRNCLVTVSTIPKVKKSIVLVADITEHKEEAERIQAAKMESLRQLVAGVAHQMNSPIGAILSSNDVSSRTISKLEGIVLPAMQENEQLAKTFAILERANQVSQLAAGGIAKIVANLRRFVRLDESEWQYADVHEGMDNVIALMESEFSNRIRVTKDYGDIPKVYCSPSSLNQVFMSLLKNASEAIEGEGEIRLSTSIQGNCVKIEVSDTGRGIPSEDMDKIFDPGFTTKGVRIGVGLGLSICYKIIVDEHRGRIDVSSELNKGTTFTVTLSQRRGGEEKDAIC